MKMGFVVEGFHDEAKVKEVLPDAFVVVTKGTRLNGRVRMDVKEVLSACDHVWVLTDPDEAGEQLAHMLLKEFPLLKRIFLEREHCLCYRKNKVKVGVEHCEPDYLKAVFQKYLF